MAQQPCAPAVTVPQDSDALVLQDPLRHFNPAYDVQSVADWSGPEMPRVGDTLTASCGLYKWIPDPRPPTGAVPHLPPAAVHAQFRPDGGGAHAA